MMLIRRLERYKTLYPTVLLLVSAPRFGALYDQFEMEPVTKTLKFFSRLSCTFHFSAEPASPTNGDKYVPGILNLPVDFVSCSFCVSIRNKFVNSIKFFKRKEIETIFKSIRLGATCTVHVSTILHKLTPPIPNKTPSQKRTQQYHDLTPNLFSPVWNSIPVKNTVIIPPDFIIAFLLLPEIPTNKITYSAILPHMMHSSKFLLTLISLKATNNIQRLLGCFTCEKNKILEFLKIHKANWDTVRRVIVLTSCKHEIFEESDFKWPGELYEVGNNLITAKKVPNTMQCLWELMKATPEKLRGDSAYINERTCIREVFITLQNISSHPTIWENELKYENSAIKVLPHTIPFGVQFHNLRFSVILGQHESELELGGSKTDFVTVMTSPISGKAWILLTFLIIMVAFALQLTTSRSLKYWFFWLMSVCLEQGESELTVSRNWRNCSLLCIWMFGTLVLRNFYTSSMTTLMTKTPEPENVPKTMEQLFSQSKIYSIPVIAEDNIAYVINKNLKFEPAKLTKFVQNILDRIKVVQITGQMEQVVVNVSSGLLIQCESYSEKANLFSRVHINRPKNYCSLAKRFAFLHDSIGKRKLHSPRFVKPMFEIFGNRKIIENVIQPGILNQPFLWSVRSRYTFLENFKNLIAALVESGIYIKLTEGYDSAQQKMVINRTKVRSNFSNNWNLYTYSNFVVKGTYLKSNKDANSDESIKFKDFIAVMVLYLIMFGCCVAVVVAEIVTSCCHQYSKTL